MSDNFVGEIRMFAGNYAIQNWALCNGQLMAINQYTTLFALLGTTFGGDGRTTFALPNLQGRLPIGQGAGPGLSPRTLGEAAGTETVTVLTAQMPNHSHAFCATTAPATTSTVGSTVLLGQPTTGAAPRLYTIPGGTPNTQAPLDPAAVGTAGASQPHSNLMPSLCVTFIIALIGIFPSRP